jgi:acyl-CoA hydrolase
MTETLIPPVLLSVPTMADTARSGAVLGGWIMLQCDLAAGRAGRRFAGDCVIRSFRELTFHAPLFPEEALAIHVEVIAVGRTSFTLRLSGIAEPDMPTARALVSAEVVMVAIGSDGKSRMIQTDPPAAD